MIPTLLQPHRGWINTSTNPQYSQNRSGDDSNLDLGEAIRMADGSLITGVGVIISARAPLR